MTTDLRLITAQETYALRQELLWPDHPVSHVMVAGDETAMHVGAFVLGDLIGVGSFFVTLPEAQLRKLAVRPECRGRGIASQIIRFGAEKACARGVRAIWCDARMSALGFYETLGFAVTGDAFDKSGVAYRKARLELTPNVPNG